jgi:hypothetical protein
LGLICSFSAIASKVNIDILQSIEAILGNIFNKSEHMHVPVISTALEVIGID